MKFIDHVKIHKSYLSILDLPVLVTGDKAFSGTVTLERDDTSLGTFNGVDLGDTISAQAFIDEDNSFSSADTFSSGKKKKFGN